MNASNERLSCLHSIETAVLKVSDNLVFAVDRNMWLP